MNLEEKSGKKSGRRNNSYWMKNEQPKQPKQPKVKRKKQGQKVSSLKMKRGSKAKRRRKRGEVLVMEDLLDRQGQRMTHSCLQRQVI